MRPGLVHASASLALLLLLGLPAAPGAPAARAQAPAPESEDPDLPVFMNGLVDKQAYLRERAGHVWLMRGLDSPDATAARMRAVDDMQARQLEMGPYVSISSWAPIGPNPAPNGQTTNVSLPVSGRVNAIAVHPANANIVYLGTASGGLYRTLDGGANWTPLMDAAQSLSIGAIAIDPVDPTTVFVGTGEGNLSLDSFKGVGLYRIRNADTAPVLEGPFETRVAGTGSAAATGHAFLGNSITSIVIDPTNHDRMFLGSTWGFGGMEGGFPANVYDTGLFFTETAQSANPAFSKVAGIPGTGWPLVTDLEFDPADPGVLLVAWEELYDANSGIYRTANAGAASVAGNTAPTFTRTYAPASAANIKLAVSGTGATMTVYAGVENASNGTVIKSVNGGTSFPTTLTGVGGFCGGQCWYDIAVAVDPTNPNIVCVGGSTGNGIFYRSTNGGTTFGVSNTGLHADVHAIAIAPSNPNVVYHGNDGGIFASSNGGVTWISRNTSGLGTIQFIGVAVHPSDPSFTIGGSQDNGTHWYRPDATWTRADWGDGGFAAIDQNAPNSVNVTMYHTYYNSQNNLVGYARVLSTASASDGLWSFIGNGANGIALGERPNFYAPLVTGPGSPNTVYYGTDRLHRSADKGVTNPVVSQAPIVSGQSISAIAIAPASDIVRLVGLNNGQVWGTVTGSSTLTNFTGPWPARYIGRIAIDPVDANNAWVALSGFGVAAGQHVWRTANLLSGTPTWTASGNGIPDVPVDELVIDPLMAGSLYAGTDIGVYQSLDGGATWTPFTSGMPTVPVFGLAIQPSTRVLRCATHGRGMWERALPGWATPTQLALTASEIVDGRVELDWYSADGSGHEVALYRRPVPGDWSHVTNLPIDGTGRVHFSDAAVQPGRSYEYVLGMADGGTENFYGHVTVTVPVVDLVRITVSPNPASRELAVAFSLGSAAPATVELVDVAGRRVANRVVEGAGTHQVRFAAAGMKPGLYWARVTQGERTVSRRVTIVP